MCRCRCARAITGVRRRSSRRRRSSSSSCLPVHELPVDTAPRPRLVASTAAAAAAAAAARQRIRFKSCRWREKPLVSRRVIFVVDDDVGSTQFAPLHDRRSIRRQGHTQARERKGEGGAGGHRNLGAFAAVAHSLPALLSVSPFSLLTSCLPS